MKNKISKIVLLVAVLNGIVYTSLADRGVGKNKRKVALNIVSSGTIKKTLSFNMSSGLKYKGSLLNRVENSKNSISFTSLITYQKGNTIYIVPQKQKILVPDVRPGYTGMKLIIKPKL